MDNKQQDEQQSRMSRSQYRQQQRQTEQQPINEATENTTDQPYSREAVASQRHDETVAEKTARLKRRLNIAIIALIVAICMIVGCNALWLYAWMQYDYESYEITADGDSNANYIGEDGNIYNGGFNQGEKTETKE